MEYEVLSLVSVVYRQEALFLGQMEGVMTRQT